MKLSAELKRLLPSEEEVAFYKEHGWYVSPRVLSDEVIDQALRGAERHWAGERDWPLPISDGFKDWKPGHGNTLRLNEFVALQNREIRRLVEQPIIGAIAARLAGTTEIRLWESELIYKPPRDRAPEAAIGWHTDRAYWMTCSSSNLVTAWIPFHDCPKELGPLQVVDGSHKWTELDHDRLREFLNPDLAGRGARWTQGRPDVRTVTLELRKGQISFHSAQLLHASGFNTSDRPRISVSVHMQDRANRYRHYFNERGELWQIAPDRMCRRTADGDPDYSDPSVCAVLWSEG